MEKPSYKKIRPGKSKYAVLDDPYLKQKYKDPTICPSCGAVYTNKRWYFDIKLKTKILNEGKYFEKKCPACKKIDDMYYMGVITLTGDFLRQHYEEIVRRIQNEEKKALRINPLERILRLKKESDRLTVETLTDNLAVRIGKAVYASFKGVLEIKFDSDHSIVHIYWKRN